MKTYFDKIYLLNLPECAKRRRAMESQLKELDWPMPEIHGISGAKMTDEEKIALNRPRHEFYKKHFGWDVEPLKRGQWACSLTHLEIYKAIVTDNVSRALVLEDDIDFNDNIHRLGEFLDQLDKVDPDWDMVLFNCVPNVWERFEWTHAIFPEEYIDRPTSQPNVFKSGQTFGLNSALINQSGARKLVEIADPLIEPMDVQFHFGNSPIKPLAHLPDINIYCFRPFLVAELVGQLSYTQGYE